MVELGLGIVGQRGEGSGINFCNKDLSERKTDPIIIISFHTAFFSHHLHVHLLFI